MNKKDKNPCYILKTIYSCKTKKQCEELDKAFLQKFEELSDKWRGKKPKESAEFAEKLDAIKRTDKKSILA